MTSMEVIQVRQSLPVTKYIPAVNLALQQSEHRKKHAHSVTESCLPILQEQARIGYYWLWMNKNWRRTAYTATYTNK
jgi:hypothetical protein